MQHFIDLSARILRIVGRIEIVLGAVLVCGIVLGILVQVALNAGLGHPLQWEQEGGAYALVWLTFIGASIGLKQMRHVTIVTFVTPAPPRIRALLRMACWSIVIWLMVTLMRELVPVMAIEGRARTVALPVELPRSYFFSVPLFVSSALMLWTAAHYFIANVPVLLGRTDAEPAPILTSDGLGVDV